MNEDRPILSAAEMYWVWVKKSPLRFSAIFFKNGWEFLVQILHTYYDLISTSDCTFLSNYLQFWRSYAILSATTHFTPCQNVHHRPKRTLAFSDISPNSWKFLVRMLHTYYTFLSTLDYKILSNSLALWRNCHIKCDHPACVSTDGGHFEHFVGLA